MELSTPEFLEFLVEGVFILIPLSWNSGRKPRPLPSNEGGGIFVLQCWGTYIWGGTLIRLWDDGGHSYKCATAQGEYLD